MVNVRPAVPGERHTAPWKRGAIPAAASARTTFAAGAWRLRSSTQCQTGSEVSVELRADFATWIAGTVHIDIELPCLVTCILCFRQLRAFGRGKRIIASLD